MSETTQTKKFRRPIDFYFRSVVDCKKDKVVFVDAFQVLNDLFLGRLNVINYFFIAENSVRINELNLIALNELAIYKKLIRETAYVSGVVFNLPITTRFLKNENDFAILQNAIRENGFKKNELIMTFDSASLVNDCNNSDCKKRIDRLRKMGIKIAVNGFGSDFNALDIFSDFNFAQLRAEASYFDSTPQKKKMLSMIAKFCNANKIEFVMEGVDSSAQLKRFVANGVKLNTGKSVCKLNKWLSREMLKMPELTAEEKQLWDSKIEKEKKLFAKKLAEKELDEKQSESQRIVDMVASNKLMSKNSKSPYMSQIRSAQKVSEKAYFASKEKEKMSSSTLKRENKLQESSKPDVSTIQPQKNNGGDWGLSGLAGNQNGIAGLGGSGTKLKGLNKFKDANQNQEQQKVQHKQNQTVTNSNEEIESKQIDENFVEEQSTKLQDSDFEKALAGFSLGFGKKEEKQLDQTIVEKKQSELNSDVQSQLNVVVTQLDQTNVEEQSHLNSDEQSQTKVEETQLNQTNFEEKPELNSNDQSQTKVEETQLDQPHLNSDDQSQKSISNEKAKFRHGENYNDQGQYVDEDGTVYNGYFDEQDRWIDYGFEDENGEFVDNGYFDSKTEKWIPYGYFDDDGNWIVFEENLKKTKITKTKKSSEDSKA